MVSAEHPQTLYSLSRFQVPPIPGLRGVKATLWAPVLPGDPTGATESAATHSITGQTWPPEWSLLEGIFPPVCFKAGSHTAWVSLTPPM